MYIALEDVLSSAACILSAFVFILSTTALRTFRERILIVPVAVSGAIFAIALIQMVLALLSNDVENRWFLIFSIIEIAALVTIAIYSYIRYPKRESKTPIELKKEQ
jgi:ABC-type Fe3+ transport system permease subunit